MWLSIGVMQAVFGRRAASALGTRVTTEQLTMGYEALRYGMLQARAAVQRAEIVPCCNSGDRGTGVTPEWVAQMLPHPRMYLMLHTFKRRSSTSSVLRENCATKKAPRIRP